MEVHPNEDHNRQGCRMNKQSEVRYPAFGGTNNEDLGDIYTTINRRSITENRIGSNHFMVPTSMACRESQLPTVTNGVQDMTMGIQGWDFNSART
jgi:hypothetical protein